MNCRITAKGALTLLVKRFASPFWYRRRWLNKTQWLSASELEALQLKLLRKLIHHCYNTVPYYRQLMDERGIAVDSIRKLEDIKQFPILTKKDILQAGDSIISSAYPRRMLRIARTGGSTGTPMVIYRNLFSIGNEHAFVKRQWSWAGLSVSDRSAVLMSRVVADPKKNKGCFYAYDPFMKELLLSTHHISLDQAKNYLETLKAYGIQVLVGYPSAIRILAEKLISEKISLQLKAVLTTSENITEYERQIMSQAFGCKVFDFYGSAERVCYIFTCEHGSYHTIPEYGLSEMVPIQARDGANSHYKIVSTGFWNFAMPLVRYDTQDIVVKSEKKCPCGRNMEVIDSIVGREGDIIITPSGRRLGVTLLIQILYVICGIENIIESQFVQDQRDCLTVRYVSGKTFSKNDLMEAKNQFRMYLPKDMRIKWQEVKVIPRTKDGKVKALISNITVQ